MTEKRQKLVYNCFRVLNVLDQLDKIDDSDHDINDTFVICKRRRENCVQEVEPVRSEQLAEESERKRCTISKPTKGLTDGQNPLEVLSNEQFTKTYRFSKECVEDILQMIAYGLTKFTNRGKPFSPVQQLLITLQFLTTGITN